MPRDPYIKQLIKLFEKIFEKEEYRRAYFALQDYTTAYRYGEPKEYDIGGVKVLMSSIHAYGLFMASGTIVSHVFNASKTDQSTLEKALRKHGVEAKVHSLSRKSDSVTITVYAVDNKPLPGRIMLGSRRNLVIESDIPTHIPAKQYIKLLKKFIETLHELGTLTHDPLPSIEEAIETLNRLETQVDSETNE